MSKNQVHKLNKEGLYLILVVLPYLGDEVHAVPERGNEPDGGVPVEGNQLLLPHQPVDIPTSSPEMEFLNSFFSQNSSFCLVFYPKFSCFADFCKDYYYFL